MTIMSSLTSLGDTDAYTSAVIDGKLHLSISDTRSMPVVTNRTSIEEIPDTVLQFQRQMRKLKAADRAGSAVTKENDLNIVYQDEYLVVTDKPSGVLCVPGVNHNPSLLTIVHQVCAPSVQPADRLVVHRLDMDTSGIVVFAKSLEATVQLHKVFRERAVEKMYEALVCGHVEHDEGTIDLPLQRDHKQPPFMRVATPQSESEAAQVVQDLQHHGWRKIVRKKPKPSTTEYTVVARETLLGTRCPVTRLALKPITGRTHQLRVHCAAMGHPIVGDPAYGIYGEASANGGMEECIMEDLCRTRASLSLQKQINDVAVANGIKMCLHAKRLSFTHPFTAKDMDWEAPVPF
jgi:tRNA pseudouridine32 synthase / 23S rRNA pseudouridine746 synthase